MRQSVLFPLFVLVLGSHLLSGGGSVVAQTVTTEERKFIDALKAGRIKTRDLLVRSDDSVRRDATKPPQIDLDIYFESNSATPTKDGLGLVHSFGELLLMPDFKDVTFLLIGHTDARGTDDYNLSLSKRRAETVRRLLIEKFGIPANRLVAQGVGKQRLKVPWLPYAPQNRRLQIVSFASAS
jgi:outer membrane protein OmpA-like peptidoglycan-associated protein